MKNELSTKIHTAQEYKYELLDNEEDVLGDLLRTAKVSPEDTEMMEIHTDILSSFVSEALKGHFISTQEFDTDRLITDRIAEIDRIISAQLNEIMHHPKFQKAEGSWRGLWYLVFNTETTLMLKIKVFNATKREILRDLNAASEFDQSWMFKKIYEEEFGQFGGEPYGCLIGDYEFDRSTKDINFLEKMSNVAAAAHAPFLSAASPNLFGWESYTTISEVRDVSKIFGQKEYIKWNSFRKSEDSRYVGLTLPRVLIRHPYDPIENPLGAESFYFQEDVSGTDHSKYCWSNAAYALAYRITDAFSRYSWTVAIRGVEGGGLVENLPTHLFKTDEGETAQKCPTEVLITDRREKELSDNGFIPLLHCKNTDFAAFFAVRSCNKPKKYDTHYANANADLSCQLQYILAISRFAHYLKVILRDKVGSFQTAETCQQYLTRWLKNFITDDPHASQEEKAKYPLKEASIEIKDIPGKPGCYKSIFRLRPHYQLEEIDVSLRLVSDLQEGGRS